MNIIATIKAALTSKTVIGVLIASLPTLLGLFDLHVTDVAAFTQGAQEIVDQLIALGGAVLAIYGRIVAAKSLVVKNP